MASKDQFNYMLQFDRPEDTSSCYLPVIKFFGYLKNKDAYKYLLSKYNSITTRKMSYLFSLGKYKSYSNKVFLLKLLDNEDKGTRYAAASGLVYQDISKNWLKIKKIYLREKDQETRAKLLYVVSKFNNKEALDILKKAMIYLSTRSDAKKILLKKGFTESQIYELY